MSNSENTETLQATLKEKMDAATIELERIDSEDADLQAQAFELASKLGQSKGVDVYQGSNKTISHVGIRMVGQQLDRLANMLEWVEVHILACQLLLSEADYKQSRQCISSDIDTANRIFNEWTDIYYTNHERVIATLERIERDLAKAETQFAALRSPTEQ